MAATFPVVFLSPAARYALSAVTALARGKPGEFRAVGDIVAGRGLPKSFLSKIFQRLARRGLIVSRRGPGGGHALARPAGEITLAEVIEAVETPLSGKRQCLLELRGCGDRAPCAAHEAVVRAEEELWASLRGVTLARYARGR